MVDDVEEWGVMFVDAERCWGCWRMLGDGESCWGMFRDVGVCCEMLEDVGRCLVMLRHTAGRWEMLG